MGKVYFDPKTIKNIYVVCSGNLGRSPALEHILDAKGFREINIYSRGVDVDAISGFDYSTAHLRDLTHGIQEALRLELLDDEQKIHALKALDSVKGKVSSNFRAELENLSRTSWDRIYNLDEDYRDRALQERGYKGIGIGKHTPRQLERLMGQQNLVVAVSDHIRKKIEDMYQGFPKKDRPIILSVKDFIEESVEEAFLNGYDAYRTVTVQLEKVAERIKSYFT